MKESMEFTDISSDNNGKSGTSLTENTPRTGCHVSAAMGFMLALVAILIAVGVGLIVHFASPAKTFECNCSFPEGAGSNQPPDTEAQWQACTVLAKEKNHCVVPGCPGGSPSPNISTTTVAIETTPLKSDTDVDIRLPTTVTPINYKVKLEPRMYEGPMDSFTFRGSVIILIDCSEVTSNITLHSKYLRLENSSLSLSAVGDSTAPKITSYNLDLRTDFLILKLSSDLAAGKQYNIMMNFSGPLTKDFVGFYLSSYVFNNKTEYLATSQLQTTHARKVFPCFDEPGLKATFDITLVRRTDYSSISNMPRLRSEDYGNNRVADVFKTTEKMSTYLLAFIVSRFESKTAMTPRGVEVRVWTPPHKINQTDYALRLGVDCLNYFEKIYDVNYSLPKLDMFTVPDFGDGAMENWGLIIFGETSILHDSEVSSSTSKMNVAEIVTHEIGHQVMQTSTGTSGYSNDGNKAQMRFHRMVGLHRMWFGDLVTAQWWDDIWLNEGFATFVSTLGMDNSHPDWKKPQRAVVEQLHIALAADGTKSSRPVFSPVNSQADMNGIFDSISYRKGASILSMLKDYLGKETFQLGVKNYLKINQFGSTSHDALWEAFDKATEGALDRVTVKEIMDTWILQMNYPVVMVTRSRDNAIKISQSRFLVDTDAEENPKYPSPYNYKWDIPFSYTTSLEKNFNKPKVKLMRRNAGEDEIVDVSTIPSWDEYSWVIGNVKERGFYRVNYDTENWEALLKQLKANHRVIATENRAQLINDAWSLAGAGLTDPKIALKMLSFLEYDEEFVPWKSADHELRYIDHMLRRSDFYGEYKKYVSNLVTKQYQRVGWKTAGDNALESSYQSLILGYACHYQVPWCLNVPKRRFAEWMKNHTNNPIPIDLRPVAYCTAIEEGGMVEWDFAYRMSTETTVKTERKTIQAALACSKETWLLKRYLKRCLESNEMNEKEVFSVIKSVAGNTIGLSIAWNFVRENWKELKYRFFSRSYLMVDVVSSITSYFNTEFDLQQAKEFLVKNGVPDDEVNSNLSAIRTNINWVKKFGKVIADWLHNQSQETSEENPEPEIIDMRLPFSLVPEEYDVELKPDFYAEDPSHFTFSGAVKIRIRCDYATDNITLHINGQEIHNDTIVVWTGSTEAANGTTISFQAPILDTSRQFFIVPLNTQLISGNTYYISMSFSAPLTDGNRGLYYRSHTHGNNTVYLASTKLEPTSARQVFPCFDEPALKAEFNVILVRQPQFLSLSNMPLKRNESRPDGFVADVYEKTVKMSTYTLAFFVGDYAYKEKTTANGVRFRVYSTPDSINQTDYTLSTGVQLLEFFEDYFNISYPLPKLDMIGIPNSRTAMENWGLIMYTEFQIFYQKEITDPIQQERNTLVISHELSHMWFGNLVTMNWWSDTWLNEGFATFFGYLGLNHIHPEWKPFEKLVEKVNQVMVYDALLFPHPLHDPVNTPGEISSMFSQVTYIKGAAVINMMRQMLGESTFRNGIQKYLLTYSYKSTNSDDLFELLSEQSAKDGSNIDVKSVMDTWVLQRNYPLVTLSRTGSNSVVISQERFLYDSTAVDPGKYPSPYNYTWEIPLTFKSNLDKGPDENRLVWLPKNESSITISDPGLIPDNNNNSWLLENVIHTGYYIVNYDAVSWDALIRQLKRNHTVLHPVERAQLFDDALHLVSSGREDISLVLRLTEYLHNEEEYDLLLKATKPLEYANSMLKKSRIYGAFREYMRYLINPQYQKIGWDFANLTRKEIIFRTWAINLACDMQLPDCVIKAKQQFSEWMKNTENKTINEDLRRIVYCTAVRDGRVAEWDFLYERYMENKDLQDKQDQLSGLTCSKQPWIISRFLERILESEGTQKNQFIEVIQSLSQNVVGQPILWDFLRSNWDYLITDFLNGDLSAFEVFSLFASTSSFNTEVDLQKAEDHVEKYDVTSQYLTGTFGVIKKNIEWLTKNEHIIADWLGETHQD